MVEPFLFIEKYHASFILNAFLKRYFTLLSLNREMLLGGEWTRWSSIVPTCVTIDSQ